jgi:hypothetical protein
MPTPNEWTILPAGVQSGTNGADLIGCQVKVNGNTYQLTKANGDLLSTIPAAPGPPPTLPTLPANFPKFEAKLGGPTKLDWYITLSSAVSLVAASGTWSNAGFLVQISGEPADSWTAQASSGLGEEEASSSAARV